MFYQNEQFPFTAALEQNWKVILGELQRIQDGQFKDWPEKHLYEKGWSAVSKGSRRREVRPRTRSLT